MFVSSQSRTKAGTEASAWRDRDSPQHGVDVVRVVSTHSWPPILHMVIRHGAVANGTSHPFRAPDAAHPVLRDDEKRPRG